MKLAFIILAHDDPDNLLRLVKRLVVDGDTVVVHWDKKNALDIEAVAHRELMDRQMAKLRFCRRVAVDWGRWSMVEATLAGLAELESSGEAFDYVILLSGADYPLKPIRGLKKFLAGHQGKEFIECVDPDIDPWVVQGLVKERFLHHHWFSWRDQRKLFEWSLSTQKKLGLKRKAPDNLKPRFGSQWWALTWATARQALAMGRQRRIRQFFKTTWVPDEMFFQTIVNALVPKGNIVGSPLTFYHFDHQGKPLVFYNDHVGFLSCQDYFFARKLSPEAGLLRDWLDNACDGNTEATVAVLGKRMDGYRQFIAVQWRGLPGRRVFGRQLDAWYGDLEWNKSPYFVILAYPEADLGPLTTALNALPGIRCFGEIFAVDRIDYALPGDGHPFYPADKPALRDMKRANFLVDLIEANKNHLIGFVLRLPSGDEIEKVVLYDRQAVLVFVLPDGHYFNRHNKRLDWPCAFHNMVMQDYIAEAYRANKAFLAIPTFRHRIADQGIGQVTERVVSLRNASNTGNHFEVF